MGTKEEEEVVIVVAEVDITEEEEAALVVITATKMMDITTDRVTVTGAEVCMTPWSASRGRTIRRTRT